MNSDIRITSQDFLALFDLEKSGYRDPTLFIDRNIGFSVQRPYPPDAAYKPPRFKDGETETVVIVHIGLQPSRRIKNGSIPIRLRASRHSRYLSNHYDYNFGDKNSPTEESVRESKSSRQPIDIIVNDAFFFDSDTKRIRDENGNEATPITVLDYVYNEHVNTLKIHSKIRWQAGSESFRFNCLTKAITIIEFTLRNVFGRELVKDEDLRYLTEGYPAENIRKLKVDGITIFGYVAPKAVVLTFCLIVAVSYSLFHLFNLHYEYIKIIFSNNFLALCHALLLLWFLDSVMPWVLRILLNKCYDKAYSNLRI